MIKPHNALLYVDPDTIAECWNGVYDFGDLYEALWDCVPHYNSKYRDNIEDIGPHDVIGINCTARFWSRFTPEQQKQLNKLAEEQG